MHVHTQMRTYTHMHTHACPRTMLGGVHNTLRKMLFLYYLRGCEKFTFYVFRDVRSTSPDKTQAISFNGKAEIFIICWHTNGVWFAVPALFKAPC